MPFQAQLGQPATPLANGAAHTGLAGANPLAPSSCCARWAAAAPSLPSLLADRQARLRHALLARCVVHQVQLGPPGDDAEFDLLPDEIGAPRLGRQRQGVRVFGLGRDGVLARVDFPVQVSLGAGGTNGLAIDGHFHGDGATHGFVAVDIDAGFAFGYGKGFESGVLLGIAHLDGRAAGQRDDQKECGESDFHKN